MITIHAYRLIFRLRRPLSISFHSFQEREGILLFLHCGHYVGLGEAAPFKPITGDSAGDVLRELQSLENIPLDPERDGLEALHSWLDERVRSHTLRAAIDYGYHDIMGKMRMIPVYRLYTDFPHYAPNSVTVFIQDSLEDTAREAKRIFEEYPHLEVLKIKLKGDGLDFRRAEVIKGVSPALMKFTLDANQGFQDPGDAVRELSRIVRILEQVILIEEPCRKGELEKMKFVKERLEGTCIIADESAATVSDVREVIAQDAAHGVNIKLQKAGGIYPARLISDLVKDHGLTCMVGEMIEGPLSTAAGAHFACGAANLLITDLDMDLDLPVHAEGGALFQSGKRIPGEAPGLGLTFDFDRIKSLAESGEVLFEQVR